MYRFILDNRKMQEATGNAEPGGGQQPQQPQQATTPAQGGAFANLMSRLGFGSNQQTAEPQQPTAQPATNSPVDEAQYQQQVNQALGAINGNQLSTTGSEQGSGVPQ